MLIYCVEDDESIRDIEVYTLRSTRFSSEGFCCSDELFAALSKKLPDLIVLDVMLPGMDGAAILKKLRSDSKSRAIPVIMATAKGAEFDKIACLDAGADDYLVKPFGMMEMVARVNAVLRRVAPSKEPVLLTTGQLTMDLAEHTVTADGARVLLSLKEFDVLHLLMANPGIAFTRQQLLDRIWGIDYDGETRTVDVHIRTLRAKLGSCGDLIETVRGVGYRMEARG